MAFEHWVALGVVRALLGVAGPPLLAVAIDSDESSGHADIYFAFQHTGPEAAGIVEEVADDLDAADVGVMSIATHVWVGRSWSRGDWPGLGKRLVFGGPPADPVH